MKRIIVFGCGVYYQRYKSALQDCEILCFIDNNDAVIGRVIDGYKIMPVDSILDKDYDYIVLMSAKWEEMTRQLVNLGVCRDKLINKESLFRLSALREVKYYLKNDWDISGDVLLVSYSLSLTGAPIALLKMAKILKKMGYNPVILSNYDAGLLKDIIHAGLPVVIEENIEFDTDKMQWWINRFDFIVLNTIMFYPSIKKCRFDNKRVWWWIHECDEYYKIVEKRVNGFEKLRNVKTFVVGPLANSVYEKYFGEKADELLYTVDDINGGNDIYPCDKISSLLIGTIMHRKGQDIFLKAFELLPEKYKNKIECDIIGQIPLDEETNNMFAEYSKKYPQIRFRGEIAQEEVDGYYQRANLLICPSREDPMPIVITDALKRRIPCVISKGCGTAKYVQDKYNAYVIEKDNVEDLARKLMYIIDNKENMYLVGKRGRELYEHLFSNEAFEKKIKELLD